MDRLQVTMQEPEQPVAMGAPGGDPLGMLGRRKLRNRMGQVADVFGRYLQRDSSRSLLELPVSLPFTCCLFHPLSS